MESASPSQPTRAARINRFARAAALYFIAVFAVGLALGPVRVLWLEPWLGRTIAVALEAPFLVAAMWIAARAAPRWVRLSGKALTYLGVGVFALLLQQIADLAVGFGLRGMTLAEQWAYFATPPGFVYAITLAVFALMPLIRRLRQPAEQ